MSNLLAPCCLVKLSQMCYVPAYTQIRIKNNREVWNSGPSAAALAARSAWKQLSLNEALSWTQSSSDVEMKLLLPAGVCLLLLEV